MQCSKHPEHAAAGVCSYSGKPYCADELVEVEGRLYSRDNLTAVFNESKARAAAQQPPPPPMVFMNAGGASSSSSAAAAVGGGGYNRQVASRLSRSTAIVLCCFTFLCIGGLHRFYSGHKVIGIIQLLTLGGFFIWGIIDLMALLNRTYRDSQGYILER